MAATIDFIRNRQARAADRDRIGVRKYGRHNINKRGETV